MKEKEQGGGLKIYNLIEEIKNEEVFYFRPEHSGCEHICLKKIGSFKIPNIYRSWDINIKDLCMDECEVNNTVKSLR